MMNPITSQMDPKVKQKWIETLRSGEYTQGRDRLKTLDSNFCCLGVLCDLHSKETGNEWNIHEDFIDYFGFETDLPKEVELWAGIKSGVFTHTLIAMNDGELPYKIRRSFNEIADWIENNL